MKSISLKPVGTAINFRIFTIILQLLSKFRLHIAAISATVCLLAVLFNVDLIAYVSALVALGATYSETEIAKGGEA